ncbi:triosephosphate isomerase [Tulasnella sp. 419]|nr:triosephosphate isomerase [Tulasnella sp. 419]
MARKFFVGGNFKMNGTCASTKSIVDNLNNATLDPNTEVVIAPPALHLLSVLAQIKSGANVQVAAQNVFTAASGAYTGEISPVQLKDAGVPWVIIGHSERRTLFGDTDEVVAQKTKAALDAGLSVIACIGETLAERESDKTFEVVDRQVAAIAKLVTDWSNVVVAYEPVWAIGTGKVATSAQAQEVHKHVREFLASAVSPQVAESTRILYGGSVTASNSKELATQPDVDGFLVGGASLKPEFVDIINSRQ